MLRSSDVLPAMSAASAERSCVRRQAHDQDTHGSFASVDWATDKGMPMPYPTSLVGHAQLIVDEVMATAKAVSYR